MKNNLDDIFPYSNFHNIFSEKDIYINNSNLYIDKHFDNEETNIKNNFEPFDIIFNNRNSRISSYDENEFQKKSLKPYVQNQEAKNIFNNISKDLNFQKNLNQKRKSDKIEMDNDIQEVNNKKHKKVIFNSFKLNPLTDEEKLEQKKKNRISARKSRLKKKKYISKLEKEHSLLMNQIEEMKQNMAVKYNLPLKENQEIFLNKNKTYCDNCSNVKSLKNQEKLILCNENPNDKNNTNLINSYREKQRKTLEKLMIEQILIMMPIKIKIFQNKYLKLLEFNSEDCLNSIKIKIDKNLQTLQELYDINILTPEENGIKKENKKNSMAQQIYNYYYNLKKFINEFEKISLS